MGSDAIDAQRMEMRSHQDAGEWWTRRSGRQRLSVASSASQGTLQTQVGTGS